MDDENPTSVNEKELMEYYGYTGTFGNFRMKMKFLHSWILHSIAYSCPHSETTAKIQRLRGVKIGKNCHFSAYVQLDLIYPHLVSIGDNVTFGSNVIVFAHTNPAANLFLKNGEFPRKVAEVKIKNGAVLFPGSIVTAGVTIGENSVISVGSVVTSDVPDYCVVVGNPGRVIKKIDH
ncbi:acyltransferase [Nitrosopumilus sp.]|uniref:acyltransferase n=1 Tax=Nitrosopumilus sp. TaxID=2024843 RepID=UPI00242F92C8|nr:acyltransferase [Nitrosopumilus sp.]MCV0366631.1 acyltransferase [Nitrosopumilus sp.]MCV0410554.1 acyltransferase [Nitrosopumilus sp.]